MGLALLESEAFTTGTDWLLGMVGADCPTQEGWQVSPV